MSRRLVVVFVALAVLVGCSGGGDVEMRVTFALE